MPVEGLDKVKANFKRILVEHPEVLARAMYREAEATITEAKQEVPVDLGALRASGFVAQPVVQAHSITVQFGFGGPAAPYAVYVHEGTGPAVGRAPYWPPASALEDWAARHGMDAHAVQWAIHEHGTQPTKYLENPWNRRKAGVIERINKAVADALK